MFTGYLTEVRNIQRVNVQNYVAKLENKCILTNNIYFFCQTCYSLKKKLNWFSSFCSDFFKFEVQVG